jgi:Zn-dependent protease/CBS domain-containing protein
VNKQHLSIGKIFNIPIGVDLSWFLILALITWSLAVSYYPQEYANWPVLEYWIVGAVTAVIFFICVLLHELGHSVVAIRNKLPVRSITLFIFGGISEITSEPPSAAAEFWIAIAGPLTSFALAAFFAILQIFVTGIAPLLALLRYLAYINGILGLFNLIPGFPLDGGRVFRAIVWGITHNLQRATVIAANVGRAIAFLFILFGFWQIAIGNLFNGIWIAFIGWFLESAANSQLSQQRLHSLLAGHTVAQAMSRNFATVPATITLQQIADEHILGSGQRFFVVESADLPVGLLTIAGLNKIPRSSWATTTAAQAMTPIDQFHKLRSDTDLVEALDEMNMDKINQLPVMNDGQFEGILSEENIVRFMRTLQELNRSRP